MKSTRRMIEISFLVMAVLSGLLLTTSLGTPSYLLIGGLGTLFGLILVDWTGWIRMPTVVANMLSFVVLYLTMRGFFSNETSGQLGSVANLLVYLQTLLVLQDKGPRQYWQLMVLSFLQLVVASVFHVQLEGGMLFLAYMGTSAIFLVLLNSYSQTWRGYGKEVERTSAGRTGTRLPESAQQSMPEILMEFKSNRFDSISNRMKHVTSWIMACLAFASVLFVLIPRSDVSWFTGRSGQAIMAGSSKEVNLDERGRINLSYSTILHARFRAGRRSEGVQLVSPPYFRTMALGSLVIENGNSTWKAPYDRVYNWQAVSRPPIPYRAMQVEITHEPSTDPTLTTVEPIYDNPESSLFGYYSNDLALITRADADSEIEMVPFEYRFNVPRKQDGSLPDSFPYQYMDGFRTPFSMSENPAEYKWLTSMDRDRYPGIVAIGDQLKSELATDNALVIAKRLESWFLEVGRFQYTLDYTNVPRREEWDSVEDFVVNHRQGHCEMFASGLAVMLRSQGIPARMALGFYGGTWQEDQHQYMVTGGHAHAWVEAYIPPEYCTDEMFDIGGASRVGGAWLRLDATPPSDLRDQFANGTDPMNLARNLWQDYVMRMDPNKQPTWGDIASSVVAGALDLSAWSDGIESAMVDVQTRPWTYLVGLCVGLLVLSITSMILFKPGKSRLGSNVSQSPLARLRRVLGKTLGVIAPGLGRWVEGESVAAIWFFDRLNGILEREGISREPNLTYREYAIQASEKLAAGRQGPEIGLTIQDIIDRFQQVRFGGVNIAGIERKPMEASLSRLAELLRERSRENGVATV